MKSKKEINQKQLFFLIVQTQIGIGFISLPFEMHNATKQDGWISILIACIFIQIFLFIVFPLFKKYPKLNIYEISIRLLKKWLGKLLIIIYILFFISISALVLMKYYQVISTWIMPHTPRTILLTLMIIIGVFLVKEDIVIISRFFGLVSIVFIIIIFFTAYSLKDINIFYIMPVGGSGIVSILNGSKEAVISMLGFEVLFIVSPYTLDSKKIQFKTFTYANIFVSLFYTFIVFTTFCFFSPNEIKFIPDPVLCMVKAQTFKVFERTDLIFLSLWIILATTTFVSYLYAACIGTQTLFSLKTHSRCTYYMATICFIIAMVPKNHQSI